MHVQYRWSEYVRCVGKRVNQRISIPVEQKLRNQFQKNGPSTQHGIKVDRLVATVLAVILTYLNQVKNIIMHAS
jgi:hypothetical protein